jgi:TonB family protein
MRRSSVLMAAAGVLVWVSSASAQEAYRIIVNPSNPTTALTKAQVSNLFLRKTVSWEDGRPAAPVDQTDAAVREAFARDVLGMAATTAFSQAQQAAAAGRGEAPVSVASDREVLAFVRLKPGAIGYVSATAPVQGVKVVALGRASDRGTETALEALPVGGPVRAPVKVVDVRPLYPQLAKQTRAHGMVEIDIIVSPTGDVEQAHVTRSVPLLDKAALDAVRKWKYAPTVVNGIAVPVKMSVGVSFAM